MAHFVFRLPDIGEGVAEAEISAWHAKVGDLVVEEQALVDVLTDKATVEMTTPVAGRVVAIHGEVGEMLAVGAPLAEFETEDAVAKAEREASPPEDNGLLAPKLPHERDETPDAARGVDRDPVTRAAADLASGREDTDCYGAAHTAFRRARTRRSK